MQFALDVELEPGLFMYGGTKRDDSLAMKSGNHEMRCVQVLESVALLM